MGLFNKERNEILKMTQENLKSTQENNALIYNFLDKLSIAVSEETIEKISEDKKIQVAYALNLCTVSVSQIVDYDDIGFLEYEYEAILNNLNLENMPKDEELLKILKQLLDVITFFRIQEEEKKMLDKEYQHKMKNAIWSAVPSVNMLVGTSSAGLALSLASMVGTGYMNYRKAKAEVDLDNEKKVWALQRSAMEQFHGLKKELFDTSWRLADKYDFKDEYRLTERQISQFNQVLLDNDPLRKCERLEYISKSFQAYPPFFYYLANAANDVYLSEEYEIEIRHKYKSIAIDNYQRYLNLTQYSLLREDQIESSAALELFEVLESKKENIGLLERAIKASNNAFDVLQICAVSYLNLGLIENAKKILRYLMNEKYNYEINTQLLSRIYVIDYLNGDENGLIEYKEIKRRSPEIVLFPMVLNNELNNKEELEKKFIGMEKLQLREEVYHLVTKFIATNEIEYNTILKNDFDITEDILVFLNKMVESIKLFGQTELTTFKDALYSKFDELEKNGNQLSNMLKISDSGASRNPIIEFRTIFEEPFVALSKEICMRISNIGEQSGISEFEEILFKFREKNNFSTKTNISINERKNDLEINFSFVDKVEYKLEKKMMNILKLDKYQYNHLLKDNAKNIEYYIKNDYQFSNYMQRHPEIYIFLRRHNAGKVLSIINDKSIKDYDLLITTKGLVTLKTNLTHKKKNECKLIEFNKIYTGKKDNELLLGNDSYKDVRINYGVLLDLMKELSKIDDNSIKNNWYDDIEDIIICMRIDKDGKTDNITIS